jgi:hypothetical protein
MSFLEGIFGRLNNNKFLLNHRILVKQEVTGMKEYTRTVIEICFKRFASNLKEVCQKVGAPKICRQKSLSLKAFNTTTTY